MLKTKSKTYALCLITVSFLLLSCNNDSSSSGGNSSSAIIIDHTSVDKTLSSSEVTSAKAMKLYLEHASVGGYISDGLDALAVSDANYSRTNFVFLNRSNPGDDEKIDLFYSHLTSNAPDPTTYKALMFKFCYIDNTTDMDALFTHAKSVMENLESTYPHQIFVWWTMPLQTTGDVNRDKYNKLVRDYCKANDKILFDIADIESHDPSGNAITQGGYEALYSSYDLDGNGHPNAAACERIAKAFWYMAYLISLL